MELGRQAGGRSQKALCAMQRSLDVILQAQRDLKEFKANLCFGKSTLVMEMAD